MGTECYLTVSMKQISLLLFCLTLVSTEWTCDDCKAAAPSLGLYATTPAAIEFQSATLVSELCPQSDNVDECVERLPVFWGTLAPIIFPEHYSHMCDDMEPKLPNCDECAGRVNAVTDYLGHDDVISDWVTALVESEFCPWFVVEHEGWVTVEECQEGLPKWLPLALKVLVKADRSWVGDWCTQFGSC